MKLLAKQDKFVLAYIANGGNATQAAITAGYAKGSARQMGAKNMANADIASAIKNIAAKPRQHLLDSIEGRRSWLQSVVDGTVDTDEGAVRLNDKLKAADMLNKMSGDYIERRHITGDLTTTFTVYVPKKGSK